MVMRSAFRTLAVATATALVLGAAACSTGSADDGRDGVDVVAAFYPLKFVSERVGGPAVRVTDLVKPGAEPHDLELSPGQVGQLTDADLVVYLKGFQPNVDEAVDAEGGDRSLDVAGVQPLLDATAGGHEHEGGGEEEHAEKSGKDPHLWLDPTRLATVADRLAERLGTVDPTHAADYTARARTLRTELEALDQEYTRRLTTCQRREIIVSHAAFGYLAQRYKLEQVGLSGLTPEDEPAPQRLAEVAREAREHGATTIFFETLVSPKVAETIAREVGARTAVLDPIEGLSADASGDYFSVMRGNLDALVTALGCS
ncbi:MAG TPA: metal ABC transporter substrate-binding protein [Micromonospora sp.]